MIVALSAGRDSSVELRERLALDADGARAVLAARPPDLPELVVLSTCHRVEVYAAAVGAETDTAHAVAGLLPGLRPADHAEIRFLRDAEAVEHLFRVACGLDSLVIGEWQVLGQVRRGYALARQAGAVGPVLSNVFSRAIRLGRRARTGTQLGARALSIGALVGRYLTGRLGGVAGRRGAIVGAGEAARDAAGTLHAGGARLAVLSRRPASAARLARRVGATAHSLEAMPRVLGEAEFAVVAVSGGPLVHDGHVPPRAGRLLMVDVSVPRAAVLDGRTDVEVQGIEDLRASDGAAMAPAIAEAEAMVRRAMEEHERWAVSRSSGQAVGRLREHAELIARSEIDRTLGRLRLGAQDAERVAAMALRIANKLMHAPTVAMRDGDDETRGLIRKVFGIEP